MEVSYYFLIEVGMLPGHRLSVPSNHFHNESLPTLDLSNSIQQQQRCDDMAVAPGFIGID